MPPLTRSVESLDTVPEGFRSLYVANDGGSGFVLDSAQIEGVEDTSALKAALNAERANGKTAKAIRKALGLSDTDDLDVEAIAAAVKANKGGSADKSKSGSQDDATARLLAKREQEIRDELAPKLSEVEAKDKQIRALTVGVAQRTAAAKAKVFASAIDDAVLLSDRYFDVDKTGKVIVLDEDGDPTSMTPEKFFETAFKKLKPHLYEGTGSSGTDAEPTVTKGGASGHAPKSPLAKIAGGLAQQTRR